MLDNGRAVIVGGSLAGLRTAQSLRREGHEGPITIISDEPHWPPYDRPPLSKQVLVGSLAPERVRLRVPDEVDAEVCTGVRAVGLDLAARTVLLEHSERVPYDGLVVATGASPRRIPATEALAGVHVLRTIDDSLALRAELEHAAQVVVVGAGFIGCEVASSCRALGLDVTIVDALPFPLTPLGARAGEIVRALHEANGVRLRLGTGVVGFDGDDRVRGVRLADGTTVGADVVVVGIGVVPATRWLDGSGLTLDDGVACDEACLARGGGDRVVAVGDVARWDHPRYGTSRIEHWTNAGEQAAHAAKALVHGREAAGPFAPVPYFWSDQFGRKLQFVGTCGADDEFAIVEGSVDDGRWVAAYGRDGVTVAALCVGWPARLAPWHQLVTEAAAFPPSVP
ncbi:NAD(P)/FAD-dependent oxidoreductase [Iamia sp. SCSIO 61187]|uniref:NAD(P)/FAD-dependent oxidoreductase n=1 Tax=Iamia sp. SCSIO 61187 TaxID=2722752 RepID=UPI001C637606|nr:FAD/NAD(P)-binding oxidoreductase [Iamia sp. SCSIO 61187]QYG94478.1 NAD(P)/FAD-dependent oxidoreductase [Iamia sp. SCSIO 61187]